MLVRTWTELVRPPGRSISLQKESKVTLSLLGNTDKIRIFSEFSPCLWLAKAAASKIFSLLTWLSLYLTCVLVQKLEQVKFTLMYCEVTFSQVMICCAIDPEDVAILEVCSQQCYRWLHWKNIKKKNVAHAIANGTRVTHLPTRLPRVQMTLASLTIFIFSFVIPSVNVAALRKLRDEVNFCSHSCGLAGLLVRMGATFQLHMCGRVRGSATFNLTFSTKYGAKRFVFIPLG